MSMTNMRHWDVLGRTDPRHTKPFRRAGGFRGTATKPIWVEMRLTEHFGPCGIGWGMAEPQFTLVNAGDEIMVFCTVRCWYKDEDGEASDLWGVGGDKVLTKRTNEDKEVYFLTDDEAYKKAYTDAVGNAFKHLGVNADVHMGLFEDSKYVAQTRKEFEQAEAAAVPNDAAPPVQDAPPHDPVSGDVLPPHTIAVPATAHGNDWIGWGKRMIAAIKTATTHAELDEWRSKNARALTSSAGTKANQSVNRAFAAIAARLGPVREPGEEDFATEADLHGAPVS